MGQGRLSGAFLVWGGRGVGPSRWFSWLDELKPKTLLPVATKSRSESETCRVLVGRRGRPAVLFFKKGMAAGASRSSSAKCRKVGLPVVQNSFIWPVAAPYLVWGRGDSVLGSNKRALSRDRAEESGHSGSNAAGRWSKKEVVCYSVRESAFCDQKERLCVAIVSSVFVSWTKTGVGLGKNLFRYPFLWD